MAQSIKKDDHDGASHSWAAECALLLVVLAFATAVSWLKWRAESAMAGGFYKEEFALQYRYARMVAEGASIPAHDFKLQAPQGIWTATSFPTLMELSTGITFRCLRPLLHGMPFDSFILLFQACFSSLSVLACYAAARGIYGNAMPALAGTAIYGLSIPPTARLLQSYGHESYSLPLLFFGVAAFAWSLNPHLGKRAQWACSFASGLFLLGGLLSWHFARFFVTAFAAAVGIDFVLSSPNQSKQLRNSLAALAPTLVLSSLVSPLLRSTGFAASTPLFFLVALAVVTCVPIISENESWRLRSSVAVGAGLLALGVSQLCRSESTLYGHVWELAWAKVRNFGVKPADPGLLTMDARILWSGAFHSPDPNKLMWSLWPAYLVCMVAGLQWLMRRQDCAGQQAQGLRFAMALAAVFVVLHLAIDRLALIAVFFLCIAGASCWNRLSSHLSKGLGSACLMALGLVMLSNFPSTPVRITPLTLPAPTMKMSPAAGFQPLSQVEASLLTWIRLDTPPNAVFAGRFNICPAILAYADRAIVLHSKFEVPGVRKLVQEHLGSLYATEGDLAAFCARNNVTHYLHDAFAALGTDVDFPRYLGDALKLRKDTPAYLMQFAPERLHQFQLVYQSSYYRVFRFLDKETKQTTKAVGAAGPLFDIQAFVGQNNADSYFNDAAVNSVLTNLQQAHQTLRQAINLFAYGRFQEALPLYETVLATEPAAPYARSQKAIILFRLNLREQARVEIDQAIIDDPHEPEAWYHAFLIRQGVGDPAGAQAAKDACLRIDPSFPGFQPQVR